MTEITTQGIVDNINNLTIQSIQKKQELTLKKQELQNLPLYLEIEKLEKEIQEISKQDSELREQGKQILITSNLKMFQALDRTIVQLNKKPWALIIEDETKVPDNYRNIKTQIVIDKEKLKKDIKQGVIIEWVSISEDYTLIIKNS